MSLSTEWFDERSWLAGVEFTASVLVSELWSRIQFRGGARTVLRTGRIL